MLKNFVSYNQGLNHARNKICKGEDRELTIYFYSTKAAGYKEFK